jgi:hypothetical protein
MADETLSTRVTVIETTLGQITNNLAELTKAVRAIADQPRQLPWKEVGATVLVMFGIAAYIGNYLEAQHHKNVAVLEYRMLQAEAKINALKP